MEKMEISEQPQMSKEDYLLSRANEVLATDVYAAKTWLITAQSLFPNSVKVQFESYRIEKLTKNAPEAAKCFSKLFKNFPDDRGLWEEVEKLTTSLRSEHCNNEESQFLSEIFQNIPQDLQLRLLIMTAEHSEDTMDHCQLLLLLLRRFPQTMETYGQRLIENLLTAEKHSHPGQPINEFRKVLACEALPILGSAPVEIPARLSIRLLYKAVEYYFACIQQPQDSNVTKPWDKIFQVIELMGKKMGWELSSLFATPWNRDNYCDKLQQYASSHSNEFNHANGMTDDLIVRQMLISSLIVIIRILTEHTALINGDQVPYCLVEAFVEPISFTESKVKKRKREEPLGVVITCDGEYNGNGLALFVKLYDLVHSTDYMQREVGKIIQQMRLESWLNPFLNDLTMYKGLHRDLVLRLPQETNAVCMQLRMASSCFNVKDYKRMIDYITCVVNALPILEGKVSNNLTVPAIRHLHYLTLARFPILQYCCKLLLTAIKDSFSWPGGGGDLAMGHALVLMQIDWPQEVQFLETIIKRILSRRSFSYPLFQAYIINVDILEELMHIWTDHGGAVLLDIVSNTGVLQNRRISTRGTDKGQREEVRQTMRRQIARNGIDALDELLQKFILSEKKALQHSLVLR